MAWKGLPITVAGRNALSDAQMGKPLNFLRLDIGDGQEPGNYNTRTTLVHKLFSIDFSKVEKTDDGCILTADFPKLDYDFYFREMGIIVTAQNKEVLYIYDNSGDDAEHVIVSTGYESKEKRIRLHIKFSDVDAVTIAAESLMYVSQQDFEAEIDQLEKSKVSAAGGDISETTATVSNPEGTEKYPAIPESGATGKILGVVVRWLSSLKNGKVDKVSGKQLSTNDYTTAEKNKLSGIASGAEVNVQPDWSETDTGSDAYIRNRPSSYPPSNHGHSASQVAQDSTHRMITDTERSNWNDSNAKKHTHGNKTILDKVTQALLDNWSAAFTHVSDVVKHVTAAEKSSWNDANNKKHTHGNKGILDGITQALLDNWNAAFSHVANKSNPHAVTKSQVGLGSVPNVATNNQTPTYDQASELGNIASGEKLSVSMGKIMKAIADFIMHKADTVIHITAAERTKWNTAHTHTSSKSNPHVVTKAQVGLGNADNTSDENKPLSTAQQQALDTKVTSSGGDIAATKVGSFTASTDSYPVPAANDTMKIFGGKTAKFFGDIKNWMTGVCLIGAIVNNCVTNNAKLPLSAAQGKVLMDLYNVLNANASKVGHVHDDRYFTEAEINAKFAGHEVAFSYDSVNSTLVIKSIYQIGNFVFGSFRLDAKNGLFANKEAQIATIGAHPKINYHGVAIEATTGQSIDFTIFPLTGHVVINNWIAQPHLAGARVLYVAFGYPCQ